MEEDIKILKKFIKNESMDYEVNIAIENLIKGYKIEKLRNTLDEQSLKEALDDYISKSKVQEKIEELKKKYELADEYWQYDYDVDMKTIEVLQELMED